MLAAKIIKLGPRREASFGENYPKGKADVYGPNHARSSTSWNRPGVSVKLSKNGDKKYSSRLKVSGSKEIHLGIFETEAEAVTIRAIATSLCRNNKVGYLDLLDDCYYSGVPPADDYQRYFVIPPLVETSEGEKNAAVKKQSKQIYIDFKKKKESSLLLWFEKNLIRDDDAEEHVNGHSEVGLPELVNNQAPDSNPVAVPVNEGTANQRALFYPTNASPSMHVNEAAETRMNDSQDSWRTENPHRQLPSCEEAAPIFPPALLSNKTAPTVDREALFAQLAFSDQQEIEYLKPLYRQIVFSYQQENDNLKRAAYSYEQENQELKRRLAEHLSCCSEESRPSG